MRLGLVCRVLRAVCRDPRAWAHVTLTPGYSHDYRSKEKGLLDLLVLKIAPAVHTMRVAYEWPAVNLSRYTNEAKVLEIEFEDATGELVEDYDKKRLFHTIHHYRNSLEVVKLSCLHEMEVLHLIDRMPRGPKSPERKLLILVIHPAEMIDDGEVNEGVTERMEVDDDTQESSIESMPFLDFCEALDAILNDPPFVLINRNLHQKARSKEIGLGKFFKTYC
ncbi:uncharacterized protein LOC113215727 [Frankliniella occidentalis]|uniref:Uncharacterized protein LOC113215727 n=1 Tax=Frankliniella occidentalis TaxID=133901 RepID=A0A9C6X6V4_FRAOC|nr:uncharacterized protein LOC113215727 [Frankliniella occidentalis]